MVVRVKFHFTSNNAAATTANTASGDKQDICNNNRPEATQVNCTCTVGI